MRVRPAPRIALVASLAFTLSALFMAALLLDLPGGHGTKVVDDLACAIAPMLAAAAAWWAAKRHRGARRGGWALIGASAAAWAAGQVVWTWYELVLAREVPFPSLADVGYLLAVPLGAAGMLLLAAPVEAAHLRLRALLDGLVIGIATLIVSWMLVLGPVVKSSTGTFLETTISLAYPVGDVIVISLAVYAVGRAPLGERRPVLLAAAAFMALAIADSGFAYLTTTGDYVTGNLIDAGWFAGYLLLAVAAMDAALRDAPATKQPSPDSLASALVPYAPFGLTLLAGTFSIPRGGVDEFVVWGGFFMVLFVASRQLFHIVDHVALLRKLRETNSELVRVQGFRAQLLNNVSHDLGTPLTPIVLQLKLLEILQPTDKQQRSLVVIRRNVDQLQRLVRDVKDVSRLQAGGLKLELGSHELGAMVREAVESFAGEAEARGIRLETRIEGVFPVLADPQRATQLVFNLITNALKFTPAGGRILVAVQKEHDRARVSVQDTGRGLDDDQISRLFQPFSQVHEDSSSKGSGLGLYISRGIAEQHGGGLDVASDGPGRGTTFSWTVPLARAPSPLPGRAPPARTRADAPA